MRPGTRLALYAAGLAVAFGGAFGVANAAVPDSAVAQWKKDSQMTGHNENHGEASAMAVAPAAESLKGLALSSSHYVLSPVDAPRSVGVVGTLSFQIQDSAGKPVTAFATAHEKDLHLIVVRSDGQAFRHVHPVLDRASGTWSLPWTWTEAGTYRVYADFTLGGDKPVAMTLTRTVDVSGTVMAVVARPSRVDQVDGYTATIKGDIAAGASSELDITITRDGHPVTTLQPYLGAFGHLVALRQGDLAYLHVHADGESPKPGGTAGPTVTFMAEAPTAGRYLLYLDFRVAGQVHTATFVLDAAPTAHVEPMTSTDSTHSGH